MKIRYLQKSKHWDEQDLPAWPDNCVFIQRFGAFGDMIQMSSILPGLKEQGLYVVVGTTEAGMEVVKNDPHVDEFFIQDNDQVPNNELSKYWHKVKEHCHKFVNLSESVEGSLLAIEGRRQFYWKKAFRHLVMGVDYLEATHAIAGVPNNYAPKFYPNKQEEKWGAKYRRKLGNNKFVIMWSVAGSSVHKVYPYMDEVFARLLHTYPDIRIIVVGDLLSSVAEIGWEKEKRIIRKCGKWSIRESLAMAQRCDLVVGPETGVLNAVSFEDVPKILMLSHSSRENIGGSWVNTDAIEPLSECHPCHKIHYGWHTCNRDENTGTAKCASSISIDRVYDSIVSFKEQA